LLVEGGTPGVNYAWNGLALLTDIAINGPDGGAFRSRLVDGLLAAKGIALEEGSGPVRQNNRLQAWSWTEGTFSWVEPTALCLLALKKARAAGPLAAPRLADAEAVLRDRVCDGGGWNYGNARVFGQDLRAYVPTTALALLSLQDRRELPAVTASLDWLVRHAADERGAMALSLAAICSHVFGKPTEALRSLLARLEGETQFLGNLHLAAMAYVALTLPDHRGRAFVVA
jgi:hypothetical protein